MDIRFPAFSLACQTLTLAFPYMVKESINNKRVQNIFVAPTKKWPKKALLNRNKINMKELMILECLLKQQVLFNLGLLDIK